MTFQRSKSLNNEIFAIAFSRLVFYDYVGNTKAPIPQEVRDKILKLEPNFSA